MIFRKSLAALALCLPLALGGCASVGELVSKTVVATTVAGPTQAKTVKDAVLITTGIEEGLDLYVTTSDPSNSTLDQLTILITALHNTLVKCEEAQKTGKNALVAAALAGFNESLRAVQAYKASKGIPQ